MLKLSVTCFESIHTVKLEALGFNSFISPLFALLLPNMQNKDDKLIFFRIMATLLRATNKKRFTEW